MTGRPDPKYRDLPARVPLTFGMLASHLGGAATFAATLDDDGQARAGVIDIDAGGEAAIATTLARLQDAGLAAFAFAVSCGDGHAGGHVWVLYHTWCDAGDIRAQLTSLAPPGAEIWPSNQAIRLPFGVHRLAHTRGQLLTQDGQRCDLDTPHGLHAGFLLVQSLRLNAAPPPAPIALPPPRPPLPRPSSLPPAGRLDARATIAAFNQATPLPDLLARYGAERTRDGFRCPCGVPHTHATTLILSRQGRLFSFSPRCRWRTEKGLDAFGLFCLVEHAGDTVAALKAITPERTPAATSPQALAREREARRKRDGRAAQMAAVRASVEARAAQDEHLSTRAQIVLQLLLNVAGTRDWCRPGITALAHLAAGMREQGRPYSERTIQLAIAELERAGYLSSAGQGGRPHDTAIRRFLPQVVDDSTGAIAQHMPESQAQAGLPEGACVAAAPVSNTAADDSMGESDPHAPPADFTHESHEHESRGFRACEPGAPPEPPLPHDAPGPERADAPPSPAPHDPQPLLPHAPRDAYADAPPSPALPEPEPLHGPDGAIAYPDGAAWLPTEAARAWWEGLPWRAPKPASAAALDPPPAEEAAPPPLRAPAAPGRLTSYRAQIADMPLAQLTAERRKHERTIQKFPKAHWTRETRARLRLVVEQLSIRRTTASPATLGHAPPQRALRAGEQLTLFDHLAEQAPRVSPGMLGVAQARAAPSGAAVRVGR